MPTRTMSHTPGYGPGQEPGGYRNDSYLRAQITRAGQSLAEAGITTPSALLDLSYQELEQIPHCGGRRLKLIRHIAHTGYKPLLRLLFPGQVKDRGPKKYVGLQIIDWLYEQLQDGPKRSDELKQRAMAEHGYGPVSLCAAMAQIGAEIQHFDRGTSGYHTVWRLPEAEDSPQVTVLGSQSATVPIYPTPPELMDGPAPEEPRAVSPEVTEPIAPQPPEPRPRPIVQTDDEAIAEAAELLLETRRKIREYKEHIHQLELSLERAHKELAELEVDLDAAKDLMRGTLQ